MYVIDYVLENVCMFVHQWVLSGFGCKWFCVFVCVCVCVCVIVSCSCVPYSFERLYRSATPETNKCYK
jgi:hypothetical protein